MRPPIKNYISKLYPEGHISQWFGENPDLYAHLDIAGHNGIDVVAPYGTPILATSTQTIVDAKYTPDGYGRHIRAIDKDFEYTYGHLAEISKNSIIGTKVEVGTEIGKMGNSGFVVSGATPFWKHNPYAGTHLHFSIRPLGGRTNYIDYPTKRVYIKGYPGKYKGSIDPVPFIEVEDIEQKKQLMLTVVSLANEVILLLNKLIKIKK